MPSHPQLDIELLLEELTLQEKISLLAGKDSWRTVPVERLNIPQVVLLDGPNGVRSDKFFNGTKANCFPCGTALAATFNKKLLEEAGDLMADEARSKGVNCILGPTANIARGPLGGRAFESYSEDPLLSGYAAANLINGMQKKGILACLKHFVCNDMEDDRMGVDVLVTERALREIYLKPFQLAFRDSNPKALMTLYNRVNGEHVLESKKLLNDVLRDEWKWDGTVMSDWFGTYSTKKALDAGLNLEMPGPTRFRTAGTTSHMVLYNELHRDVIDENVRHILKFINNALTAGIPFDTKPAYNDLPVVAKTLRKVGAESVVLLKNNGVLPLAKSASKGHETIAVIGPNAKAQRDSGGGLASMDTAYVVTPFEGIAAKLKEGGNTVKLSYSLGAHLDRTLPNVGTVLTHKDGKPGIRADFFHQPPEAKDREQFDSLDITTSKLFLCDFKSKGLESGDINFYIRFEGYYTPEVSGTYDFGTSCMGTSLIYVDDKLVVDNKTKQEKGDAFFLGMGTREERNDIQLEKGKQYKVVCEFGTNHTSPIATENKEPGGVYFGFDLKTTAEELLAEAVELAKSVDKVVLVVGLSKEWESEGYDRPDLEIPGYTNKLVEAVAAVNKNVVVVNQLGSPVSFPWASKVQALVQAWYGGNELGNALADVLFGDQNPSGKLSMTFPEKLEDNPSFLNFESSNGRVLYGEDIFVGYRYYEKLNRKPLYAFGHGLSYTTFDFSNVKVSVKGDDLSVSVDVKNTGKVDGAEVVQLYVLALNPTTTRPNKELRDFEKVFLKAGASQTVQLNLPVREATSYWDTYKNKWRSDKDTYKVLLGASSDRILAEGLFEVAKTNYWLGL